MATKRTHRATERPEGPASILAQVRLRPDEARTLETAMRTLELGSTSDALREALRLLNQKAAEVAAAQEIHDFYNGHQAPLPAGVPPATASELAAADEYEW